MISSEGVRLVAGDLEAASLPRLGMLGASLRWRGLKLLRRIEDLEAAAAKGSTAGIPLLHPWANRPEGLRHRAAGREVVLDPASPLLHLDDRGLPISKNAWARPVREGTAASRDRIAARLDWTRPELLAIFPFPHRLELDAALSPHALTIATTLVAGPEDQTRPSISPLSGSRTFRALSGAWSFRRCAASRSTAGAFQWADDAFAPMTRRSANGRSTTVSRFSRKVRSSAWPAAACASRSIPVGLPLRPGLHAERQAARRRWSR